MRKPELSEGIRGTFLNIYDGIDDINIDALHKNDFNCLRLKYGKFDDLSVFEDISNKVDRLYIVSSDINDIDHLYSLKSLKTIDIDEGTVFPLKHIVDLSRFEDLQECILYWSKQISPNLFKCKKLQILKIWKYKKNDLAEITDNATCLKQLKINQSSIKSLKGIECLNELESLELYSLRQLKDFSSLKTLRKIKHLNIEKIGQFDASVLADLKSLEELGLGDPKIELEDLSFMKSMVNLKQAIISNQLKNQDFSGLFQLKNLEFFRFIALRNYVAKDDELFDLAKKYGRDIEIQVLGRGRKEQTITVTFLN